MRPPGRPHNTSLGETTLKRTLVVLQNSCGSRQMDLRPRLVPEKNKKDEDFQAQSQRGDRFCAQGLTTLLEKVSLTCKPM